ncbi:response regulator [Pseudoalteromonas luteoviolacea]|uniref:hybrid sensor histidine kinase/response regulator transcription factor n=1 Tax=Pseudoalteromonas luteoviolacea TaxID=43657 RepID=UPI001EEE6E8E|nr:ATP-binding protein [Pseudoalteromonas luteoviolacea]MCF6440475.1 response regulator [Pseudoalteromonas luteoviolacea]
MKKIIHRWLLCLSALPAASAASLISHQDWKTENQSLTRSAFQDSGDKLWYGTDQGVIVQDTRLNEPRFISPDILDLLEILKMQGYIDKGAETVEVDGQKRIYLTAHSGVPYFNPSRLKTHIESGIQSRSVLTEHKMTNADREVQEQLPFKESNDLELTYQDDWFSIRLSRLNHYKTDTQRVEDKQEGSDEQVLPSPFKNWPEYGIYAFEVTPTNSVEEHSFDIKMLPPIWRTWPAYAIYFGIGLSLIWIIVFLKQRALKLKANELSQAVDLKTVQLKEANEQLAQKHHVIASLLKEKNNMFTQISHELRTPLTLILSPIEQLMGQMHKTQHTAILSIAKRNVLILQNLVDQLLQLVKLESKPQHTFHAYDVNKSLDEIIATYTSALSARAMTISRSGISGVYLRLVSDSLEICVSNLLSNAVKFSPKGSEVRVSFEKNDTLFVLTVSDEGVGINEHDQAVIFEKFHRLPPFDNKELISGSGIGLSIVQELMLANHGQVKVRSTKGKGSQFSLEFPVECEVSRDCVIEEETQRAKPYLNMSSLMHDMPNETYSAPYAYQEGKSNVLIIEDNSELSGFLQQLLAPSYNCLSASDGLEGVEKATDSIPDLIITDIMMPKLNGYEVTHALRGNQLTCHIPIIMLTAKSDSESRLEGWKHHADDYIGKPFDNHELIVRIENLISIRKMLRQSLGRGLGTAKPVLDAENDLMKLDNEFILKFEKVIEQHYQDEAFSRTMAASEMHISERQLNRKLAHLLDHNFSEYLRKYRLRQSLNLIHSGLQIAQIAEDVGFSSPSYFSHCFKAEYGKTVSQHRKDTEKV